MCVINKAFSVETKVKNNNKKMIKNKGKLIKNNQKIIKIKGN